MICILFSERASCWGAEKHCSGATGVSFTHNKWSLIRLNIKVVPNSPSHFSPKSPSHFFPNSPSHFFLTRSGSLFSFSISFSLFLPKTPREIMVQALQALWCSCFACLLFWWTENVDNWKHLTVKQFFSSQISDIRRLQTEFCHIVVHPPPPSLRQTRQIFCLKNHSQTRSRGAPLGLDF